MFLGPIRDERSQRRSAELCHRNEKLALERELLIAKQEIARLDGDEEAFREIELEHERLKAREKRLKNDTENELMSTFLYLIVAVVFVVWMLVRLVVN